MAKEFKLPDLGEGIHEAQVVSVLVNEGDTVKEDQMVVEVETDKAAVELPVPFAGLITKLNIKEGDTITVGQVLLAVEDASGDEEPSAASQAPQPSRAPDAQVDSPREPVPDTAAAQGAAPIPEAPVHGPGPIPAAPAVRRLAREMGIDLRRIHGTGPGGRIIREDIERYQLSSAPSPRVLPTQASAPTSPVAQVTPQVAVEHAPPAPNAPGTPERLPDFAQWGPVRREKVPQIRKTIARQMTRAWSRIPHVTHVDEADVTDLESFRKEQGSAFAEQGAKLSLTAFILKAAAGALREFSHLNATFDEATFEIIYKDYINIGVAVDTPRGLMVPVVRDVDRKGLVTVSKELKQLADRARDFKIDVADMRGGTFTVTNVGALGGTVSTPMINWPEVAILGLGKLEEKPVVRNGQIVARKILPLFLSFDHRIIDGADGARFLNAVTTFLENPVNLLLVS